MKPKYKVGDVVESIGDLANGIINDHKCFYFNGKIQNWAWLQNLNLRTLNLYVASKGVRWALPNEDK